MFDSFFLAPAQLPIFFRVNRQTFPRALKTLISQLSHSLSIHIFFFSPSHNNIIHVFTCKCRDSLRFAWIFAYEREIFIPFTNTQYQKCDLFTFIFDSPLIREQAIPVFVCMFFFFGVFRRNISILVAWLVAVCK